MERGPGPPSHPVLRGGPARRRCSGKSTQLGQLTSEPCVPTQGRATSVGGGRVLGPAAPPPPRVCQCHTGWRSHWERRPTPVEAAPSRPRGSGPGHAPAGAHGPLLPWCRCSSARKGAEVLGLQFGARPIHQCHGVSALSSPARAAPSPRPAQEAPGGGTCRVRVLVPPQGWTWTVLRVGDCGRQLRVHYRSDLGFVTLDKYFKPVGGLGFPWGLCFGVTPPVSSTLSL